MYFCWFSHVTVQIYLCVQLCYSFGQTIFARIACGNNWEARTIIFLAEDSCLPVPVSPPNILNPESTQYRWSTKNVQSWAESPFRKYLLLIQTYSCVCTEFPTQRGAGCLGPTWALDCSLWLSVSVRLSKTLLSATSQDMGNALRGIMSANAGTMSVWASSFPNIWPEKNVTIWSSLCALTLMYLYSVQLFLTVFGKCWFILSNLPLLTENGRSLSLIKF